MKIALCQMSMTDDISQNVEKSFAMLKTAAEHQADIMMPRY